MEESSKNLSASLNNFKNHLGQIPKPWAAKSSGVPDVNMLYNPRGEEVPREVKCEWEKDYDRGVKK